MNKVFFSTEPSKSAEVFKAAELDSLISPDESVALKIHFGQPGNTAYLKPEQVKPITDAIKTRGGRPFYTDCNSLYDGPRKTTFEHMKVAHDHGYTEHNAGAEAIIPEEDDFETIEVNLKHFKKVFIGGVASRAKVLIALTHFKGHELAGFGGTLKNLGMGLGTRRGKLKMHQDCANCQKVKECKKNQTIEACWTGSPSLAQEKIVEYAYGVLQGKKTGFISFLTSISPACDCYGHNDPPVVPDIGVLASLDPVALDQASVDLVNKSAGKDIFREIYPRADWTIQLQYAEAIGMGKRKYELVRLG
jgi:uncharacterized protein